MRSALKAFLSRKNISLLPTPSYVYFPEILKKNIKIFSKFIKNDIAVLYAVKAGNYDPMIAELINNGFGFDVASQEECEHVLSLGANPSLISFSAPTKKKNDIIYASERGIKYYAFDTEDEIEKIVWSAKDPILFARVDVNVKDAVFDQSSKFGVSQEYLKQIIKQSKRKGWPVKGITFHVGSQNTSLHAWNRAFISVKEYIKIAKDIGVEIEYVNLGGGIPAQYNPAVPPAEEFIERISFLRKEMSKSFPQVKFSIEPGRSMAANTMALLTKVMDIKPYKKPPVVIVDTGIYNGVLESLEYFTDFDLPIYSDHISVRQKGRFKIAGLSCDGSDIIKQSVLLPKALKVGDVLAIMYAGAYTFVYENFHMVPYPKIIPIDTLPSHH